MHCVFSLTPERTRPAGRPAVIREVRGDPLGTSTAAARVLTNQPTRALVTTGIHGWSRNFIYAGLFLLYCGIGLAAHSPWTLILTLPLFITIRYGVVAREEAYLEWRFGEAYRDYRARVRRCL
jgi:protein-S-isoprenylcysteine O-methyltransferase Ste14